MGTRPCKYTLYIASRCTLGEFLFLFPTPPATAGARAPGAAHDHPVFASGIGVTVPPTQQHTSPVHFYPQQAVHPNVRQSAPASAGTGATPPPGGVAQLLAQALALLSAVLPRPPAAAMTPATPQPQWLPWQGQPPA